MFRYTKNIFYYYRKICVIFLVLSVLLPGLLFGSFALAQNVQVVLIDESMTLTDNVVSFAIDVTGQADLAFKYGTSPTVITETGSIEGIDFEGYTNAFAVFAMGLSQDTKYYYKIINTQTNEVYLSDSFTTDPAGTITGPGDGTITGPGDGTITGPGTSITVQLENPLTVKTLNEFIKAILDIVLTIGIPIVALAIIYSGFLFVTAGGDPERLKKAKGTFLWVIIGAAILLGAWVLAQAIGSTIEEIRSVV